MTAIEFRGVAKTYRHTSRRFFRSAVLELLGRSKEPPFYALKDLSFHVCPGESLAVVGGNGAGKSTLLSLIAGLSWPDQGLVQINGRIAALLELGAGFHPDLTGAENLRINAALLGLSRKEIDKRFDEIVEFSGIGDFIDEPLRKYSSGMGVRLAFAVSVNVQPDILLIDEVLAVGDQAFQARCAARLFELKQRGTTIVCVSHGAELLKRLCDRAIWLDHGRLLLDGEISAVLEDYETHLAARNITGSPQLHVSTVG